LVAASKAYVATALEHPALFALMFRFDVLDLSTLAIRRRRCALTSTISGSFERCQDDGWQTDLDTAVANTTLWASSMASPHCVVAGRDGCVGAQPRVARRDHRAIARHGAGTPLAATWPVVNDNNGGTN
jgi:hypothetical protein